MEKQSPQTYAAILKLLFVGPLNVGKTSLIYRQTKRNYKEYIQPTIGVDFQIKKYQVNGLNVKAHLWDGTTSGNLIYNKTLAKCYLKGCQAIIICFDLNNYQTFSNLQNWLQQMKFHIPISQIFLVGCKSDLKHNVSNQEIQKFSLTHGVVYFQTSAKEGTGINQLIKSVIGIVTPIRLEQMKKQVPKIKVPVNKSKQRPICQV